MTSEILATDIKEYPLHSRGKVRDVYDLGDRLLIIATDRLSAFDVVLPNGIPGRGIELTRISVFWFAFLKNVIGNHLISADVAEYPRALQPYRALLEGRSMLVKKARRVDVECIVRGYISGSLWKEYLAIRGQEEIILHGFSFPAHLREFGRLTEPIFTPSTKAETGHDQNISFDRMTALVGLETARKCREKSLAIYRKAAEYALTRGIIIADTKFEFGYVNDDLILIDEVLTPDSSRFWPADRYRPGETPPSFDKQVVRDYLNTLAWDKIPPGPPLPEKVVNETCQRYREVVARLIG